MTGSEDFLSRWSSRKLKSRSEPIAERGPADDSPAIMPPDAAPSVEAVSEKSDAEVLEDLGLPDPDGLVKGDDFRAFLRTGVPARLRSRALRRLWLSDPVLANLDGLNDYDQDFTDKATVLTNLKTVYRIGKGYMRDPEKPEETPHPSSKQVAEAPAEPDAEEAAAEAVDVSPALRPAAEDKAPPDREDPDAADPELVPPTTAEPVLQAHRMRFRFDAG